MENTVDQIGEFKVFDTPEELAVSMNAEPQAETQVETAVAPEPQVETQVEAQEAVTTEPSSEPQAEPSATEDIETPIEQLVTGGAKVLKGTDQQESTEDSSGNEQYSEAQIDGAISTYLSEKLGRDILSLDDLTNVASPVDERVEAISKFVTETGRSPQEWFTYQSLNTSEMDDITTLKVDMAIQYPTLSSEEVTTLIQNKYNLDPSTSSEQQVKVTALQAKVDAAEAKSRIEETRMRYAAPEPKEATAEGFVNEQWLSNMKAETSALTGLEFDLGNEKTFTFGLDDRYRQDLINKNSKLDNYFDSYVQSDGSWDYDSLNSHRAIVDNIDSIVSSTYRQGLSDGQKNVVQSAANVSTQAPQSTVQGEQTNKLAEQVQNILRGNSSGLTFKI
tara:strand:- start:18606 stop:19778 length:1173 start_codon:yes stop_codon:yes gene_type:complete